VRLAHQSCTRAAPVRLHNTKSSVVCSKSTGCDSSSSFRQVLLLHAPCHCCWTLINSCHCEQQRVTVFCCIVIFGVLVLCWSPRIALQHNLHHWCSSSLPLCLPVQILHGNCFKPCSLSYTALNHHEPDFSSAIWHTLSSLCACIRWLCRSAATRGMPMPVRGSEGPVPTSLKVLLMAGLHHPAAAAAAAAVSSSQQQSAAAQ
jgi:hypothetical protein